MEISTGSIRTIRRRSKRQTARLLADQESRQQCLTSGVAAAEKVGCRVASGYFQVRPIVPFFHQPQLPDFRQVPLFNHSKPVASIMHRHYATLLIFLFGFQASTNAQWTAVCSSGNGFVDNLEVFDNGLYATGFFNNLCGVITPYLARYDGTSFQPVGTGLVREGHQLRSIGSDLFFVGYEPGTDSNWVYRWDGTTFQPFGEGVYLTNASPGFSQTANLYALLDFNGSLVACGEFDRVGARAISGIMQWNGSGWDSLGSGLSGNIPGTPDLLYPHELCVFGTDLVVVGNFAQAGGQLVNGIARWDGANWFPFGAGFNGTVYAVGVFNGELYAGGSFSQSGTTTLRGIARWDGTNWVDPGFGVRYTVPGLMSFVHTFKTYQNNLIVSGGFNQVFFGNDTLNGTAVFAFTGNSVDTLGGGWPGREAEGVAEFNGQLFVGGGTYLDSYVARYDLTVGIASAQQDFPDFSVAHLPDGSLSLTSRQVLERVRVYDLSYRCLSDNRPLTTHFTFPVSVNGPGVLEVQIKGVPLRKLLLSGYVSEE